MEDSSMDYISNALVINRVLLNGRNRAFSKFLHFYQQLYFCSQDIASEYQYYPHKTGYFLQSFFGNGQIFTYFYIWTQEAANIFLAITWDSQLPGKFGQEFELIDNYMSIF